MAAAGPSGAAPCAEKEQARGAEVGSDGAQSTGADVAMDLRPLLDSLASAAAGEELKRRLKPVLQVGGGGHCGGGSAAACNSCIGFLRMRCNSSDSTWHIVWLAKLRTITCGPFLRGVQAVITLVLHVGCRP